ncbi:hypothetical protein RhiirA4_546043 [Rhizophagus irregularis]|uniref:Uncharacterized protein n=1 Tax=Rhizophagus irregularis TaxID=588596 RepID=A0A2I1GVE0_9GLOM|nr:hypothetical protein RhiirA4_546043 [Rhizophagus irregularis]
MKLNLLLSILSIILFSTLVTSDSNITYTENVNNTQLLVYKLINYEDNTVVAQILRINNKIDTSYGRLGYLDNYLSLRIFYPNGTIKPIDLSIDELQIQPLNFHIFSYNKVEPGLGIRCPIEIYAVKSNFILVTYIVAEDANNSSTYYEWALTLDFNGNIRSNFKLGPSFLDAKYGNIWLPNVAQYIPNADNEKGFLRSASTGISDVNLQQLIITEDGIINQIAELDIPFPATNNLVSTIATLDGNYAIIYSNNTNSTTDPQNPLPAQGGIYAQFIEIKENIVKYEPVVLYQTTVPLVFNYLICSINYAGTGHVCVSTFTLNNQDNSTIYYLTVQFLSRGSVFIATASKTGQIQGILQYNVRSLRYGGFFFCGIQQLVQTNIYGYVLEDNGNQIPWNLINPTVSNIRFTNVILPNNTLVFPQPEGGQSWNLIFTDLPKLQKDAGYENIVINATIPTIGQLIDATTTNFLTITYNQQIDLTNGTITIFQSNGSGPGIIRQIVNGIENSKYVSFIDSNTVNITVIDSTFNNLGATYYVKITNAFVSSHFYSEPLFGLSHDTWHFTTLANEQEEESKISIIKGKIQWYMDDISGQVRLSQDGTAFFDGLNRNQRIEFFNNLTQEIANALAITPGRITTSWKFQIDTSLPNDQKKYLLSINIKKGSHPTDRRVDLVVKDLDTMIKNMEITTLMSGYSSKYLDPNFGYEGFPRWIDENRNKIIITFAGFVFLTLLVFLSIIYDKKRGQSFCSIFSIFLSDLKDLRNDKNDHKYGHIIASFVTDLLFATVDSKSIQNIFYVSVFFITFPYLVRLMFCIRFILEETDSEVVVPVDSERGVPTNSGNEDSTSSEKDPNAVQKNSGNEVSISSEIDPKQKNSGNEVVPIRIWLKNENDDRSKYRVRKIILTAIIIIAGFDFAALDILESKHEWFGFKFNAKKSEKSQRIIDKGDSFVNFIEEIPKLVIKAYLLSQVVKFSYITVLSLTFSTFSIIKLFREFFIKIFYKTV